jgi:hypothetical protein
MQADDPQKNPSSRLDLVRWVPIPSHGDERGILTVVESGVDVPFEVQRVYFIHNVRAERGGHAHRDTHQVVIAASGSFQMLLSDGRETRTFMLNDPARGLLLCPLLYIRMQNFSPGAVGLVLASTHYEKSRSIRSWEEYLWVVNAL